MNPTARYDLRPGEWRPDPPHVAYGCDRNGIAVLLEAEQRASPWTSGESEAGPAIEVEGRVLGAPPSADDIEHLVARATPAPYGRGEETVLDPKVRQALQVEARHVRLGGPRWVRLREEREGVESALRARYVETVAAIDLDAEAAPSIARWLGERIEAATPVDGWVEALRGSMGGRWGSNLDVMPGVPALLRALCASPETGHVAQALLGGRDEPPTSIDAVLEEVGKLETRLEEEAWRRRRRVRWTADEAGRGAPKDNR